MKRYNLYMLYNMKIVYITDTESIRQMKNFWNKDMKSQNKKENKKEWIGGEYYIQTSLYYELINMKNCIIIDISKVNTRNLISYFQQSDIIIVPGWHNEISIKHKFYHLFVKFNKKIFSYIFFSYSNKNYLDEKKFVTPWKYRNINNFIPITPIKMPQIHDNYSPSFQNYKENGLIHGKCISHVMATQKIDKLYEFIGGLKYRVFTVLRNLEHTNIPLYIDEEVYIKYTELILKNDNINNLGILNPIDFRLLLRKIKYIVFFHTAKYQPTILEALYEKCIILSTVDCVPDDLISNKNIYLIDNLNQSQINKLIGDIENNKIHYLDNEFPVNYTVNNKINCINNLMVDYENHVKY